MMNYDIQLTGNVGGYDFDSGYVDYILDSKKGKCVNVLIDSLGGMVSTGLSISGAFSNHGDVTVTFRGMNASAATIASLGAKKICMQENSLYLIHKCSAFFFEWAYLNEDEVQQKINELDHEKQNLAKIDLCIAKCYANKCKKSCEDIMALMEKELWLTADEALEWGFIDEIVKDNTKQEPQMVITADMKNKLMNAGIPVPSMLKEEEKSFFEKIAGLFNKNTDMNETEKKVAELQAEIDNKAKALADATANAESLQTQLNEANAKNEELSKSIDELKAKINDLEKTPGDETHDVVDDHNNEDEQNPIDSFYTALENAKNL